MNEEIQQKIEELKSLGGGESELEFWSSIAPEISPENQQKLLKILGDEIALINDVQASVKEN